jgi:hypothetical protein
MEAAVLCFLELGYDTELVPTSTLEAEARQATTSSTTSMEVSWVKAGSSLSWVLPLTFRRHIHLNKS